MAFDALDLITSGPLCQPFSMRSKRGGFLDERDMFLLAVRAVRQARPRAFVFENVQGLTRAAFADYFDYPDRQSNMATTWPACASGRTSRAP